jgi:hypothetical protein
MKRYKMWDEGASEIIEAEDMGDAKAQAEEWIRDGEWGDVTETLYLRANVAELDDDDNVVDQDSVTVTLQPQEPDCEDGQPHDWTSPHDIVGGLADNPGVFGHGGGVRIHEVCSRCGLRRVTDTWAQDPSTGVQGLESVSYNRVEE